MSKLEEINNLFEYDETSPSSIRWKNVKRSGRIKAGDVAGTFDHTGRGVWKVRLFGKTEPVQNIVWQLVFNYELQKADTVHFKNNDKTNTQISNLYLVKGENKNPQINELLSENWEKCFEYFDGNLYWIDDLWVGKRLDILSAKTGSVLNCFVSSGGYYKFRLVWKNGRSCKFLHRLIYEHQFGKIPNGFQIDHINGDRLDNRIENLRCVPQKTNNRNRKKTILNTTGFTGVSICKDSYVAEWCDEGVKKSRSFSMNKYGEEVAFDLACNARIRAIEKLNEKYGKEGYTEDHGERL